MPESPGPPPSPTLEDLAERIEIHARRESDLFEVCGSWSADGDRSEARGFFAAQSAFHGWRAEQWLARRPRSELLGAPDVHGRLGGWTAAVEAAGGLESDAERLAAWCGVLAPAVLVGMRTHSAALSQAADQGIARLLDLFAADLSAQWLEGQEMIWRWGSPATVAGAVRGVSTVLGPLWEDLPASEV